MRWLWWLVGGLVFLLAGVASIFTLGRARLTAPERKLLVRSLEREAVRRRRNSQRRKQHENKGLERAGRAKALADAAQDRVSHLEVEIHALEKQILQSGGDAAVARGFNKWLRTRARRRDGS